MSDDNKKKVVLGTTMALLLGAGSYWALGSGRGSDSDGLNSGKAGTKIARVIPTDDSGEKEPLRRFGNDRGQPQNKKVRRDRGATRERDGKTLRPQPKTKVTKTKNRKPQA